MKGMDVLASTGGRLIGRRALAGLSLLVLVAACSGGGAGAASPPDAAPTNAATTPVPSAQASVTSTTQPSGTAAPTPKPSAADCMDPETADLIVNNLTKLKDLSPAQLTAVITALKAMNDPATTSWRDELLANINAKDWYEAGLAAGSIVSGQITLKKCP
jgi:hypothetical protein